MAAKIHIMQPELANKIAAGEVVQRPGSVVKELLENSLDAKATRIEVYVKEAGKSLIQVVDDGEGMSDEDALTSFQRHATSKLHSAEELEHIRTLGFRGEALASITAVAQVEMKTRTASSDVATLVRIEGNELREHSKTASNLGTSIAVRNLFYNTPARRNFLKTRTTELKNITDVVSRMAIANPDVGWFYSSDDEVLLDLKPQSVEGRLTDLFGEHQFQSMVPLHEATEYLTIDGFIGKPEFARKTRVEQFLFLNKRFILSRMVNHAVFQAFEHLLVRGSYPFFILHLTLDPSRVDVNVHPSKMEVKFENDSSIYRMVLSVVRRTLAAHDLVPTVSFQDGNAVASLDEKLRFDQQAWNKFSSERALSGGAGTPVFPLRPDMNAENVPGHSTILRMDDWFARPLTPEELRMPIPFPKAPEEDQDGNRLIPHTSNETVGASVPAGRAIWQTHNKYIVSQIKTGLMIVDQHAAHERVLYERIMANFGDSLPTSQQLLFPQTIALNASDYSLVMELLPHLGKLGFDMKLFGKNTVVIEGIPADVRIGNEKKILQDVLDEFKNNEHASTIDARDNLAKSFACKAAIKAGDRLNANEMVVLIDQLFATQMPYVCPHGRPVVVKIALEELDRRFGRT
ncbi:MAG: DNA mismatch repair endonuclease MutL [Bacteroidota bacterium]